MSKSIDVHTMTVQAAIAGDEWAIWECSKAVSWNQVLLLCRMDSIDVWSLSGMWECREDGMSKATRYRAMTNIRKNSGQIEESVRWNRTVNPK